MSDSINTQRRGFLTRLSKPIVATYSDYERTPRKSARPPNAVDEALFERLCNGCNRCVESCPNSVIELNDDKAELNLDYNTCSFCKKCIEACQTGALHNTIESVIDLQPSFSTSCNNYLQLECDNCASSCPQQAIVIAEGELPTLNIDYCDGCGLCRSACYIGAVSLVLNQNQR